MKPTKKTPRKRPAHKYRSYEDRTHRAHVEVHRELLEQLGPARSYQLPSPQCEAKDHFRTSRTLALLFVALLGGCWGFYLGWYLAPQPVYVLYEPCADSEEKAPEPKTYPPGWERPDSQGVYDGPHKVCTVLWYEVASTSRPRPVRE